MTDVLEIVILGIVQGVSEFLPISSDGHLVVVNAILEHFTGSQHTDVLERTVALHAGTLLATLVVYGRALSRAIFSDYRTFGLLIVGTIPAVIFGLIASQDALKHWLENPLLAGFGLIATGIVLLAIARPPEEGIEYQKLSFGRAALIGLFQATAILPGVSRSGTTIASGLKLGLARRDAATFSFLLSIPAVAGACTLESLKMALADSPPATPIWQLAIGVVVAFFVGLAALFTLLRMLQAGRLYLFGYYVIPLGICVVLWQLLA